MRSWGIALVCTLVIACHDLGSELPPDKQPPPGQQQVSFRSDIQPLLHRFGCDNCHGGSGGLFVQTVAQILQGGDHGPAVVAGNADSSNIIRKVSPNPPFGDRMPQGGPYLSDSTIQVFRDWINQGARDN